MKTSLLSDLVKSINTKVKVQNTANAEQKSFRQIIAELKLSLSEMRQTKNLNVGKSSNVVQTTSVEKNAPFTIDEPLKSDVSQAVQKSSSTEIELPLQTNSDEKTAITLVLNEKPLSFQNIDSQNESANNQSQNPSENAEQHQQVATSETPHSAQTSSNGKVINVNTIADSQNAEQHQQAVPSETPHSAQTSSNGKVINVNTIADSQNTEQHQQVVTSETPHSAQISSNGKVINVNTIADSQNAEQHQQVVPSETNKQIQRMSDNKVSNVSTIIAKSQNVSSNSTSSIIHHNEKFTAIQADKSSSQRVTNFNPSFQKSTPRTQNRRLHILNNSYEKPSAEENHFSAMKPDPKRKSMNQENPSTVYVKTLGQEKHPNPTQINRTHLAEAQHAVAAQNRITHENQLQPRIEIKRVSAADNTEKPKDMQQMPSFTKQTKSQRSVLFKSAFNSNKNNVISRNAAPEKDIQNISLANQQVVLSEEKISAEVSTVSQVGVSARDSKADHIASKVIHSSQSANAAELISQRNSLASNINTPSLEQIRIIARKVFLKIKSHDSRTEFLITKRQMPTKLKVSEPIKIETFKLEIAREIKKDSPTLSSSKTPKLYSKTTNSTARLINNENAKKAYSSPQLSTVTVNRTEPNVNLVTERVSQQEMSDNLDRIIDNIRPYLTRETVTERAVMDLSPPNLGRLEIQIEKQREVLKISMRVSNEEAKEIVEKGSKNLIARLNSMGFKVEEFQVKVETERNDHSEQNFQHEQHERRRQQKEQQNHTDESEVNQDDQRD